MKDTRMIIGDVGGTNCRLASCDPLSGRIEDFQIFAVRDFKSLGEVIQVFKESHSSVTFNRASIAIANPIVGDMIKMTNAHWAFSIEQTLLPRLRANSNAERATRAISDSVYRWVLMPTRSFPSLKMPRGSPK